MMRTRGGFWRLIRSQPRIVRDDGDERLDPYPDTEESKADGSQNTCARCAVKHNACPRQIVALRQQQGVSQAGYHDVVGVESFPARHLTLDLALGVVLFAVRVLGGLHLRLRPNLIHPPRVFI